jgi:hypothetical protein
MTLKKFNDDFVKYRPEPRVKCSAIIIKKPYCGSGGRWYVDVDVVDKEIVAAYHCELEDKCPGTFVEGYMKLKIPMMKGVFTYTHRHPKRLDNLEENETINITITCAGMFNLNGVWKPSWKLKVLES